MSAIDASQRNAAKAAGFFYLLTFAIVVYSNFGIHNRLKVSGNAAATAQKIVEHQTLFRAGVALDLLYCIGLVAFIAAFYVVLKPVNQGLALLSTFWKLVYAAAFMVLTMKYYDVLRLVDADYMKVFEPDQLQALARLYLSARFDRYYGGLLLYALGGTLSSYLLYKSNYIPRAFAAFGVASYAWCLFCAAVFIIVPDFTKLVNLWAFDTPMALFEIALSFWFLFKGLRSS